MFDFLPASAPFQKIIDSIRTADPVAASASRLDPLMRTPDASDLLSFTLKRHLMALAVAHTLDLITYLLDVALHLADKGHLTPTFVLLSVEDILDVMTLKTAETFFDYIESRRHLLLAVHPPNPGNRAGQRHRTRTASTLQQSFKETVQEKCASVWEDSDTAGGSISAMHEVRGQFKGQF